MNKLTAVYWLYLTFFIIIVFIPELIQNQILGLSFVASQELVLFIFSCLGCIIFLIREKQIEKITEEKNRIQREINRSSKDLTSSYSYIGESNRRLDILESVIMDITESKNISADKEIKLYKTILSAVEIVTKSNQACIHFVDASNKLVKEIKSRERFRVPFADGEYPKKNSMFVETKSYIIARSPQSINNVKACIIILKKNNAKKIENTTFLKTLASLTVFLYSISKSQRPH